MSESQLAEHVEKMRSQEPLKEETYFCVGLFCDEDDTVFTTCQTRWVGFTDSNPPRDIREPSPIDPVKMLELLDKTGRPGLLVNSEEDIYVYLHLGGHGVIPKRLCEKHIPFAIQTGTSVNSQREGRVDIESAPNQWTRRAPTKKKRVEILKRDNMQCSMCGRSPYDYVDVELHVHHIRPWAKGGLTEEDNLITLCKTCHDGLDPHHDPSLFDLIDVDPYDYGREYNEYWEQVSRYREWVKESYKEQSS
jgi:hypothetical protein